MPAPLSGDTDGDHRCIGVADHVDGTLVRRELDGIRQQVQQDLAHFVCVGVYLNVSGVVALRETELLLAKLGLDEFLDPGQQGVDLDYRSVELDMPSLDLCKVQDVVNEREKVPLTAVDALEIFTLGRRDGPRKPSSSSCV